MYHLYGISNCDTVKKAKKHLESKKIDFEFHDFKKNILTVEIVERWRTFLGELPVNQRGRTFRQLKEQFESSTEEEKIDLILKNTSLIKRPVLEKGKSIINFGYDVKVYDGLKK